jgi:hypothetical protein
VRGSVHWGCYYATAEVRTNNRHHHHRRCFGCSESDFVLQRLVACRALETERVLSAVDWLCCNDIPEAVKCASVSRWTYR